MKTGDWVHATDPVMGFAQGPSVEHGDGAPREIPSSALCEIYSIDRTTGWVTIHFDVEDSGPRQPFRVEAIVDAGMLTMGKPGLAPDHPRRD